MSSIIPIVLCIVDMHDVSGVDCTPVIRWLVFIVLTVGDILHLFSIMLGRYAKENGKERKLITMVAKVMWSFHSQ